VAIFIYLFMIAGMALILVGIMGSSKLSGRHTRLPQEAAQARRPRVYTFLSYVCPFSQKLLEKLKLDVKMKNKLDAAHVRLIASEFFNLKLLLVLSLGIPTFFLTRKFGLWPLAVVLLLGYIVPDILLQRKIAQRREKIKHFLPETVDLLGLCVEAGLDFTSALKWIIEKKVFTNPMVEELAFVLEEIKWGKPRVQALKDMSKRLNIIEVSSFVRLLIQAERMGTPVAEAFGVISEDTRMQRFRQGERFAMKAPIKILIPLIFCILPVIGIVVGGPILLKFLQGGLIK